MEREALIAVALLVYGILHGFGVAYIERVSPRALPLARLITAPVGISMSILAVVPFIGWDNARIVMIALAVSGAPVMLILGYKAVNDMRSENL